jgi:EmrB/QacA subfamily drug resistance transporter
MEQQQYEVSSKPGRLILAATIIASGMAFLEGTAVNLAVPPIQLAFGASLTQIQWVINSFALTLAAFLLISGSLSDRFGRKKIFTWGIVLFVISSLACGLARNITVLIAFRALQGLAGAMMIPGSLTIIRLAFKSSDQGRAIGLWSGLSGGVAALGPFIGGALIQVFGWPSVFYLNLPLGILAFFLTIYYVPESRNTEATKLDWWGTTLITLSLFGLSYGLINAPLFGWHNYLVLSSFIGGLVLLVLFVVVELKTEQPLVPLKIFHSSLVSGANLVTLLLYFALYGMIFFVALNLEQAQGLSPFQAGLGLLPAIVLITFLSGPAGRLADRIGSRKPMIWGPLIVCAGMALLATPGVHANYFLYFMPGLILFGGGMALLIPALVKCALAVDEKYSGSASGVNNAVSRVAALLAVAVLGVVALSLFSGKLHRAVAASPELSIAQKTIVLDQTNKLGGIVLPNDFAPGARLTADHIIKQSLVSSFRQVMIINAILAFCSAVIAYFLIKDREAS